MSKDVLFKLELSFVESIVSDDDLMLIAQGVANAIIKDKHTREYGQGVDFTDNPMEMVRVTPWYLHEAVIEHV
jgi:hypothetical protein